MTRSPRSRSFAPDRLVQEWESTNHYDREFMERLLEHKGQIMQAIRNTAMLGRGRHGLNGCEILLFLGEIEGTQYLLDRVRGGDRETRQLAMMRLAHLPFDSERGGYQVPLDKQAIFENVAPLIDSSEPQIHRLAQEVLERLGIPEADAFVRKLLHHRNSYTRMSVARWLARRGIDDGALGTIEALLFRPDPRDDYVYWLVGALEDFCTIGEAGAKHRAGAMAVRYIRNNLDKDDVHTGNYVWTCVRGLAAAGYSGERAVLQEILDSKIVSFIRGIVLQRIAELEGDAGIQRLFDALKDEALYKYAAEGLAELAKQNGGQRVIDAILEALRTESSNASVSIMIEGLIRAGGASRAMLRQLMPRVDPSTAMTIHWILKGYGPRHLLEVLIGAGMTDLPQDEAVAEWEARWEKDRHAFGIFVSITLGGVSFTDVLVKTADSPADYVALLDGLCAITRGAFEVDDLTQTPNDAGGLDIAFTFRGKPYTIRADHLGRYYDLSAALVGLNAVLKAARQPGRFFQLKEEGEVALVVFGRAREFLAAARKFRIPIEFDHGAAREASMTYTNQILRGANATRPGGANDNSGGLP